MRQGTESQQLNQLHGGGTRCLFLRGRKGLFKAGGPGIRKLQVFSLSLLEVVSMNLEPLKGTWLGQRQLHVLR